MAAPREQLHDIADPRPLLPGIHVPLWFWICLAVILAALLTAVGLFLLRRRPEAGPPEPDSYSESRRALERLRDSLSGRSLAEVATEASLIMRHYLASALQEPALYETHEEFLLRADALDGLPAGARERLAPLLDRLAEAKYSPSAPDRQSAAGLVDASLEVLQGLESTRERQVA